MLINSKIECVLKKLLFIISFSISIFSCNKNSFEENATLLVEQAPYSNVEIPLKDMFHAGSVSKSDLKVESVSGQDISSDLWIWPISGVTPGDNILMGPEEILYNEKSNEREPFGGYVIGGEYGTPILAPADGKIDKIQPFSFSASPYIKQGMGDSKFSWDLRKYYGSASIEFTMDDGTRLAYRGMRPVEGLEANSEIKKGEVIGFLHFYFTFIPEPALYVELLVETEERNEYFKEKNTLSQNFLNKESDLDNFYEQIKENISFSLSPYYNVEQPALILRDESEHFSSDMLWPIKGEKPGSNIIISPGEERVFKWSIGEAAVFSDYIIGGNKGDEILAMTDGIIKRNPRKNSYGVTAWSSSSGDNREDCESSLRGSGLPEKYAEGGCISVLLDDGRTISYYGIAPREDLKKGMKVKKGEMIGTLSYFFVFISEPALRISIHDPYIDSIKSYYEKKEDFWYDLTGRKHGLKEFYDEVMTDPETANKPFDNPIFTVRHSIASIGEETNFFAHLSLESLVGDFNFFKETLTQNHPDLYHFITPENLELLFSEKKALLHEGMTILDFYKTLNPIIRAVRGDHLFLKISVPRDLNLYFPADLRVIDNKIYITSHTEKLSPELKEKIPVGTEIVGISGKSSEQVIREVRDLLYAFDGDLATYEEYDLHHKFMKLYNLSNLEILRESMVVNILTANGESITLPLLEEYPFYPDSTYFTNSLNREEFSYLSIKGKEVGYYSPRSLSNLSPALKKHIPELKMNGVEDLIIDLRGNPGGNGSTADMVFSLFYSQPFRYVEIQKVMNKESMGSDYSHFESREGEIGYYGITDGSDKEIIPADEIFEGNVYIFIDPYTLSAAGTVAYLFKLYDRGVLIGQSSGTPSGWMNAYKHLKTELPETGLSLHIPLVHTKNITSLDGGSILPDYEVNISLEDFLSFPPEERDWNRLNERKMLGVVEELIKGRK